ncbi:hypothetical protein LXL04_025352 [Taraxacum kok-saghyz]
MTDGYTRSNAYKVVLEYNAIELGICGQSHHFVGHANMLLIIVLLQIDGSDPSCADYLKGLIESVQYRLVAYKNSDHTSRRLFLASVQMHSLLSTSSFTIACILIISGMLHDRNHTPTHVAYALLLVSRVYGGKALEWDNKSVSVIPVSTAIDMESQDRITECKRLFKKLLRPLELNLVYISSSSS